MSTRRRSPLVLVSTAAALDSILSRNCSRAGLQDTGPNGSISKLLPIDKGNPSTVLRVGLLLTSNDSSGAGSSIDTEDSLTLDKLLKQRGGSNDLTGFDELTTVGVSASLLRRLSISSGSWVFLKDTKTNVVKPARVMVLDPPGSFPTSRRCCRESDTTPTRPSSMNKSFPIFNLLCPIDSVVDAEVAYLSPMLAFNLGLHISWLEFLTSCASDGKDWSELLELKGENSGAWNNFSSSRYHSVAISPFIPAFDPQLAEDGHLQDETLVRSGQRAESPRMRYASHMRVGLVRIPSDSLVLPSMKGRQAEIDASLQDFFRVNRFLGKGDIFSVQLGHGRGPIEGHTALYHDSANAAPRNEWLLFKVLALEPSTELLLCVNHVHTALVLGGSVAAQLPPLSWTPRLRRAFLPTPAVQQLTSLLAPCLHPRVPPLQLRISVLIHGPSGSGKQTVLRLAAEDLGMHVVAFNCYDFVGATEGKTTAAVVNSFKTAKRLGEVGMG